MTKVKTRNSSGITLIALVLTIIVLLILAGISIAMLSADNSILQKATTAKETTGQKQIEERVGIAYNSAIIEDIHNSKGKIQESTLEVELAKEFPGSTIEIDTTTDTTGKKWYVTIDGGTPIEVEAGRSTSQVATLPTDKGTKPYYPSDSFKQLPGTDLSSGLVITDATDPTDTSNPGNEYVWIEVPSTALDSTATGGPDYSSVSNSTDYTNIATALRNYCTKDASNADLITIGTSSSDYKTTTHGYTDTWYDGSGKTASESSNTGDTTGCGLTSSQYTTLYNKMLKSIYENGGFWIGRYEAGTTTARQSGDSASGITPLSKIDLYPINWVTCSEAQIIASSVPNKGSYNSSLMFGIQWDLVLRHLSNKGVATNILTGNSETWGIYDLAYDLNQTTAHGYKGVLSLSDYSTLTWSEIGSGYSHSAADWSTTAPTALSTGATTRNMKKNIYDLAGNMFEWTLEKTSYTYGPCALRGGYFYGTGSAYPASCRIYNATSGSGSYDGFRVSLY